MPIRYLRFVPLACFLMTGAANGSDLVMKPGRYEVTEHIEYGPNRPRGFKPTEDVTEYVCHTERFLLSAKVPMPLPEDCRIENHRENGPVHEVLAKCDGYTMKIRMEQKSLDTYSLTMSTQGGDSDGIKVAQISRYVGACTAQELEEAEAAAR